MDLDAETLELVRDLYAAEMTLHRRVDRPADEQAGRPGPADNTVVYYLSDHGVTLGENGVIGKYGAAAQWHIHHVPYMIRHPEGKLAGQSDDYFASTHDVAAHAPLVLRRARARA